MKKGKTKKIPLGRGTGPAARWEPERADASEGPSMATPDVVSPCPMRLGLPGLADGSSYCLNRSVVS
jgi:hypothetical protein